QQSTSAVAGHGWSPPGGASRRPVRDSLYARKGETFFYYWTIIPDATGPVNAKCIAGCRVVSGRLYGNFVAPLAPNSVESRSADAWTRLATLFSTWSDIRQIGPEMPSAPITSPVKL